MERPGHEDVKFFTGIEVEHTPAFGHKTLFVVGVQPVKDIAGLYTGSQVSRHNYD